MRQIIGKASKIWQFPQLGLRKKCSNAAMVTQERDYVGSVAGEVGRRAESWEQELQYFSPKHFTQILRISFFTTGSFFRGGANANVQKNKVNRLVNNIMQF